MSTNNSPNYLGSPNLQSPSAAAATSSQSYLEARVSSPAFRPLVSPPPPPHSFNAQPYRLNNEQTITNVPFNTTASMVGAGIPLNNTSAADGFSSALFDMNLPFDPTPNIPFFPGFGNQFSNGSMSDTPLVNVNMAMGGMDMSAGVSQAMPPQMPSQIPSQMQSQMTSQIPLNMHPHTHTHMHPMQHHYAQPMDTNGAAAQLAAAMMQPPQSFAQLQQMMLPMSTSTSSFLDPTMMHPAMMVKQEPRNPPISTPLLPPLIDPLQSSTSSMSTGIGLNSSATSLSTACNDVSLVNLPPTIPMINATPMSTDDTIDSDTGFNTTMTTSTTSTPTTPATVTPESNNGINVASILRLIPANSATATNAYMKKYSPMFADALCYFPNENSKAPFRCPDNTCRAFFQTRASLQAHFRKHTEFSFNCQLCKRTFARRCNLVEHVRVHTGERPFQCSVSGCGKGFKQKHCLKEHMRSHTGERPYQCQICAKKFAVKHNLSAHVKLHDPSSQYECPHCRKMLKSKHGYKRHLRFQHNA